MTEQKVNMILAACPTPHGLLIGDDQSKTGLPWRCPGDLAHFKEVTTGHTLIVGRKTYMKLPSLPGRRVLTVSTYPECYIWRPTPGIEIEAEQFVFRSVEAALEYAAEHPYGEVFIAGGAKLYQSAVHLVNNKVYFTRISLGLCNNEVFGLLNATELDAKSKKDKRFTFLPFEFQILATTDRVITNAVTDTEGTFTIETWEPKDKVAEGIPSFPGATNGQECFKPSSYTTGARSSDVPTFEELAGDIGKLVSSKNKAYGSAFDKADQFLRVLYPNGVKPEQFGDMLCVVRIFDKLMRISTNDKGTQEGLEDAYGDITGYGLLGLRRAKMNKGNI
jgi:dihydrofolate reductase